MSGSKRALIAGDVTLKQALVISQLDKEGPVKDGKKTRIPDEKLQGDFLNGYLLGDDHKISIEETMVPGNIFIQYVLLQNHEKIISDRHSNDRWLLCQKFWATWSS